MIAMSWQVVRRGSYGLVAALTLAAALVLSGCSGSDGPAFDYPTGVDPDGGTWQTMVLTSGADIELPPPPASGSPEAEAELAELRTMQAARTAGIEDTVRVSQGWTVLRWNELARELVASDIIAPPNAARVYAILSVAQHDALIAAWHNKYLHDRGSPLDAAADLTSIVEPMALPCYPSEDAVVAGASCEVLTELFPDHAAALDARLQVHADMPMWNASAFRSDIEAGLDLGRQVARRVIDHCATDGSDVQWAGTVPTGPGIWYCSEMPEAPPVTPQWAHVRPWLMARSDQFRADAPPAFGSAEFDEAVQEVYRITSNRTFEQARIASIWQDGAYTYMPAGHWNDVAGELIFLHRLNPLRAARVMAMMNMAQMDAGIAAWDTKYAYWLLRPSQADPRIDVGDWELPNFPAYTSGHSCFSGAASEVLAWFFPTHEKVLRTMADESGLSRVYGGVHYMFDNTEGLAQGAQIAGLAIDRAQQDGAAIRQTTATQQVPWYPEEVAP